MASHVSAWFNRPLSSCKRRQDCQVLEGCTARVTPLRYNPCLQVEQKGCNIHICGG